MRGIEVIDMGASYQKDLNWAQEDEELATIVILSLLPSGEPDLKGLPENLSVSKIIAFSPAGDCGLLKFSGENQWRYVAPFSLKDVINEVFDQDIHHLPRPHPIV